MAWSKRYQFSNVIPGGWAENKKESSDGTESRSISVCQWSCRKWSLTEALQQVKKHQEGGERAQVRLCSAASPAPVLPLSPLGPGFHAMLLHFSHQGILLQEAETINKKGQLLEKRIWSKEAYAWRKTNFRKNTDETHRHGQTTAWWLPEGTGWESSKGSGGPSISCTTEMCPWNLWPY